MIPFIFVIIVFIIILLAISFILGDATIGLLASIGMLIIGVYSMINGIEGINSILVEGISTIFIAMGAYIFINGSLIKIAEVE